MTYYPPMAPPFGPALVARLTELLALLPDVSRECLRAQARRDVLRSAGLCINGGGHGRATHGTLCARCRRTHNRKNLTPAIAGR